MALLSTQERSTREVLAACAVSPDGAKGGVVAVAWFEYGEQPAPLHARTR